VEEQTARRRFDLKSLKMWRLIQVAALLPLILIGTLMIYFDQASPFGIVVFFLILVVGVIIPQLRGDLILSHFLITKELEQKVRGLEATVMEMVKEQAEQTKASEPAEC
jgi:hypothetical protein